MPSEKYRVTASALNVRSGPSTNDEIIGVLNKGDVVEFTARSDDGGWLGVRKNGLEGWSSGKYLQPVEGDIAEEFPWMPIAIEEKGVKEVAGSGDNPRIVEYLRSTSLPAPDNANDETPWCSAFVNWCVERSGLSGTNSAWAKSWLNWGKRLEQPRRGCIAVFKRGKDSGHVAFFLRETNGSIEVLGGNQSDSVCISKYPKERLLGFRIPK